MANAMLLWSDILLRFNAIAAKLCKELQILFGKNMKYSGCFDGKFFLRN